MDYRKELYELRRRLSETPGFPKNFCFDAANSVCATMGLDGVGGFFINGDAKLFHCWNYDPNNDDYVDLTADQFDPTLPSVLVIPRDSKESRRMYVALKTEKGRLPSIGNITSLLRAMLPPQSIYGTHDKILNWNGHGEKDEKIILKGRFYYSNL